MYHKPRRIQSDPPKRQTISASTAAEQSSNTRYWVVNARIGEGGSRCYWRSNRKASGGILPEMSAIILPTVLPPASSTRFAWSVGAYAENTLEAMVASFECQGHKHLCNRSRRGNSGGTHRVDSIIEGKWYRPAQPGSRSGERSADEAGEQASGRYSRTRILDVSEFDRFAPIRKSDRPHLVVTIPWRNRRQFPAQGTNLGRNFNFPNDHRRPRRVILNTDHKSCAAVVVDKRRVLALPRSR